MSRDRMPRSDGRDTANHPFGNLRVGRPPPCPQPEGSAPVSGGGSAASRPRGVPSARHVPIGEVRLDSVCSVPRTFVGHTDESDCRATSPLPGRVHRKAGPVPGLHSCLHEAQPQAARRGEHAKIFPGHAADSAPDGSQSRPCEVDRTHPRATSKHPAARQSGMSADTEMNCRKPSESL